MVGINEETKNEVTKEVSKIHYTLPKLELTFGDTVVNFPQDTYANNLAVMYGSLKDAVRANYKYIVSQDNRFNGDNFDEVLGMLIKEEDTNKFYSSICGRLDADLSLAGLPMIADVNKEEEFVEVLEKSEEREYDE